jgi:hypothetical protein
MSIFSTHDPFDEGMHPMEVAHREAMNKQAQKPGQQAQKPGSLFQAVVRHFGRNTGWVCDTLFVEAETKDTAEYLLYRWYETLPIEKRDNYTYQGGLQIVTLTKKEVIR